MPSSTSAGSAAFSLGSRSQEALDLVAADAHEPTYADDLQGPCLDQAPNGLFRDVEMGRRFIDPQKADLTGRELFGDSTTTRARTVI